MNLRHISFLVLLCSVFLAACVPNNKYQAELARRQAAEAELAKYKHLSDSCATKLAEIGEQLADAKKQIMGLQGDTTGCGMRYRLLSSQYDQLTANYELLLKQNKDLMARQANENNQLVGKLNLTQDQLIAKEDSLKRLSVSLLAQKHSLDSLTMELMKRQARVHELEAALAAKDSIVNTLRTTVKNALTNFQGNGLDVYIKNGKVYVSMEDKLLFASGSYLVSDQGKQALKQLAKVLEQNPDISIMVEGHTDDVPLKGSGDMKDNWDLSVIRATAVVKIILDNGKTIDPKRITASGRSQYDPVDPGTSDAARAKNRRTDIILSPKLDEVFKVLDAH